MWARGFCEIRSLTVKHHCDLRSALPTGVPARGLRGLRLTSHPISYLQATTASNVPCGNSLM